MARLIAEKTRYGAELVEMALEVVRDPSARSDDQRLWQYCHNFLAERMAGKPAAVVAIEEPSGESVDFAALTDEQLAALAELDATARPQSAAAPGAVLRLIPPPAPASPEG